MTENISSKKKTSLQNKMLLDFVFLLAGTKMTHKGSWIFSAAMKSQHPLY